MRLHVLAVVMATLCFSLASSPANASHVSIDFGPIFGSGSDGDDFGTNTAGDGSGACVAGSSGPESCPLTLLNDASSIAIPLGFSINFGTGPVSSLYITENGIVSFTTPITTNSFSSLASLGKPVIAPFYADLTSVTFVGSVFEMLQTNFRQLMYQRGSASAVLNADGNFEKSDEVPAFSVLWYGPTDAAGTQIFTQIIIYSHASSAANDFDLRIRYGLADTDQYNTGSVPDGIAGFVLGSNILTLANPILGSTDYFYSFRGGVLVGSGAAPPPVTLTCPSATTQVGVAYRSALTAAGGVTPYTFSYSGSLPAGLALNSTTGAVTGTPTAAGAASFTGRVVDSSGTAAGTVASTCTITVSPAVAQLSVTPSSVSFGTVQRYSLLYKMVTLKNTGTTPVSLGKISLTLGAGTNRYSFATLSLCGHSLAAGNSCPLYVVLFADAAGSLSAILNIPNGAAGSLQAVPLNATVTKSH